MEEDAADQPSKLPRVTECEEVLPKDWDRRKTGEHRALETVLAKDDVYHDYNFVFEEAQAYVKRLKCVHEPFMQDMLREWKELLDFMIADRFNKDAHIAHLKIQIHELHGKHTNEVVRTGFHRNPLTDLYPPETADDFKKAYTSAKAYASHLVGPQVPFIHDLLHLFKSLTVLVDESAVAEQLKAKNEEIIKLNRTIREQGHQIRSLEHLQQQDRIKLDELKALPDSKKQLQALRVAEQCGYAMKEFREIVRLIEQHNDSCVDERHPPKFVAQPSYYGAHGDTFPMYRPPRRPNYGRATDDVSPDVEAVVKVPRAPTPPASSE